MQEAGVLANGLVTMINKTAEQLFANNKAVFAFNGSWCVNVYKGMNPNLNYGAMLPPKVSDKYPMAIWGGAGSSFMVNLRSKNKEEAVKFLKWLTERDQQAYLSEATQNLPANAPAGFAETLRATNSFFVHAFEAGREHSASSDSELQMFDSVFIARRRRRN
jgi:maltose-binding protein MalE